MTTSVVAVRVQLLGGGRAFSKGQEVTFSNDKRHQLLAYLAYAGDWVNREKLADLFYTDTSDVARQNLRRLLQRVQELAWLESLEIERTRLRWKVETDYAEFRKALEGNDIDKALSVYTGSFLKGLESYEDNEFATWLEVERERLHGQWRSAVFKKARELKSQLQFERASRLLQKLLEQDEFDEEALLVLMQVFHANDQSQQALKTYQTFSERLKREMGLAPSSATQQFAEALEQHKITQPTMSLPSTVSSSRSLHTPATSFIGRDLELAEIASLLDEKEVRLLTLLGPGGVGKTRIALQAASELAGRYREGAHFVSLESLTSPNAIPQAVAEALAILLQGQEEPLAQVIDFLKPKNLLLALDNFEHLVDGATIVSQLVQSCPELDILVTSRERLNLDEEHVLSLEGLSVPKKDISLEDALSYDAITLFVERGRRVRSSFTLTNNDLLFVLEICRLVQGFPLGIELAAAWVKLMSCQQVAEEIAKNLDFLESSSRNATERHRSIRATFEYSWKLLTAREQETLRKLSVFRGGFTREAASFVTNANIAVLAALVDKSLLRVSEGRYDFHPLLQHYAKEKFTESTDEEMQTRARHAQYFLNVVENMYVPRSFYTLAWLKHLAQEHENLLAVLEWSQSSNQAEIGLRLAGEIQHFWSSRGYLDEGRYWLRTVLSHSNALGATTVRARALHGAGNLAMYQADYATAKTYFEEALNISQTLGSEEDTAKAMGGLGYIALDRGDYETAKTLYTDTLDISKKLNNLYLVGITLNNLAIVATHQGDDRTAQKLHGENLEIQLKRGDPYEIATCKTNLGLAAWRSGDYQKAIALLKENLETGREISDVSIIIFSLSNLGVVFLDDGDINAALRFSQEALELRWQQKDKWGMAFSFESLATIAATQQDFSRAARLWGAAEVLREEIGSPIPASWRPRYERFVATAKEHVDETTFETHWQVGRKTSLEQAVAYALE
jgi:predicted ATPase/DNA-binding SARP family transcriptional activator